MIKEKFRGGEKVPVWDFNQPKRTKSSTVLCTARDCKRRGNQKASGGIRTRDLYLTKVTLYQAELPKHESTP